ncbi:MAG: type II CRISPR RNA-guided endonuclease Cas9 [Bryobacter sp.]|nr:type II CRISPR RNA-guided endonuclease Cas9 [Bryobacter sp.]
MLSLFDRKPNGHYVLGIDLGSSSVGLALLETESGEIVHTTARIFPAGMTGSENDWENGKEASNAAKRREARGQRRQTERRKRRLKKLFHILRSYGWMPNVKDGQLQASLNDLDTSLSRNYNQHQLFPYFLRARALDHPLSIDELGRAIYHLAQRRGFQSNRKTAPKSDEDQGVVYQGIDGIRAAMAEKGARTLGEYFASLDPHSAKVRRNWTHRTMYIEEFLAIWEAQQPHHPTELTEERKSAIFETMFFQRPLKDQSHLIGFCDLEPTEKRASLRNLEIQRYRYLSALNNLRLYTPELEERPLTLAERQLIIAELDKSPDLAFAKIKSLIGVKKSYWFSQEKGGEKKIPGNLSASRIYSALPCFWTSLSPAQQADLVEDLGDGNRHEKDEDVFQCLREKWQLNEEEATKLSRLRMPPDYASVSLAAARKLLPLLEQGLSFAAAKHQIPEYRDDDRSKVFDLLPPVNTVFREIRNPAVLRSLTEMRKCVNAFLRHFGKPDEIHIELARDLRRSKKERMSMTKLNRDNEKARDRAKAEIAKAGNSHPSASDIEKFLLWEECGRTCPYSGKPISYQGLFDSAQFEIEHIIPYSRSLDNSRANKTLCHIDYNRQKGDRTPHEAFGAREDWHAMVDRVRKMNNPAKYRRFVMEETDAETLLKDFTERQLTDTKYASKLAAKYLGTLYGGKADASGRQRIVSCAGQVTAALRRVWDMNRVLNEKPEKSRDDHRHHAVDAVAIALCSMKWIKALSQASQGIRKHNPLKNAKVEDPWPNFREELRDKIWNHTAVSHRPMRKLGGALHEETIYSRPIFINGEEGTHIRKPVTDLKTESAIESIADKAVREAVLRKFLENGKDAKKFEDDPPRLPSGVPIKRVRIRKADSTVSIGSGPSERRVITGSNHHMELLAVLDHHGKVKGYRSVVVSHLEANLRKRAGVPVVQRDHGDGLQFLFSLSEGDMVVFKSPGEAERLCRVRGVSMEGSGRLSLSESIDSRLVADIKKAGKLWRPMIPGFLAAGSRKVRLDHLGALIEAND